MTNSINGRMRLLAAVAACTAGLYAQGNYTMNGAAPYSYIALGGGSASALAGADDEPITLNLPFAFRFYGSTYTSACVSPNGLMSFGACVEKDFTNLDLTQFAPKPDAPLIAPFWSDLSFAAGAGSLLYGTVGSAPNRQFVLEWSNATVLNTPGTLNFQVVLAETLNTVTFQYANVELGGAAASKGGQATVGIRAAGGQTNGLVRQFSYGVQALSNGQAILFTPPPMNEALDVTAQFKVSSTALVYSRTTGLWSCAITLKNISAGAVARPLTLQLRNLPANVTGLDATGTLPGVGPYYTMPGAGPLENGASVRIVIRFNASASTRVTFTTKVYSGQF